MVDNSSLLWYNIDIRLNRELLVDVGSNAWNGSSDGLFAFNCNNSVSIVNVNYSSVADNSSI